MPPIEYRTTDIKNIELIRPLWVQFNDYHHTKAKTFRHHYEQMTFDNRETYFEKLAATRSLRFDLAFDPQVSRYVERARSTTASRVPL
jgi:hypothetical protein